MTTFLPKLTEQYQPYQINAQGLNCPLPLLKLKQALNQCQTGDCIYIITSDANSPIDIERYCKRAQHDILMQVQEQPLCHLIVQKG